MGWFSLSFSNRLENRATYEPKKFSKFYCCNS